MGNGEIDITSYPPLPTPHSPLPTPLPIRREDRNGETSARCEGQLVQIAALIEGSGRARRVRVEVDRGAQDGLIIIRVKLQPTASPRRHEGVESRSDAREVIRDARTELA